ncbi:MAG: ribonuclease H-like YkuK family protein [Saprospiraceae bacterium]
MKWRTFNGEAILTPLIQKVEETILNELSLGNRLKLCIGTDSKVTGDHIEYATVIVFLREGKGGFMFVSSSDEMAVLSLNHRMIKEVAKSIDVAYSLCGIIDKYQLSMEIHADINTDPNFKSNSSLKEAMGYILSMGFVFKAKPDAFASSYCADKAI